MLALAGGKGGCGKTTTTLGLAAALDGPAVVVDTDRAMPNLHALAGVDRHPTLADLTRRTRESETDSVDSVTQSYPDDPSVSVVPAPPGSADCDLAAALTRLAAGTDAPILLDCPAGAGPDAAAPLRVADGTLLVGTLCAPGLRDTAKTAAMSRALGTAVHGAVLTRTRLAPPSVTRLLDCPVAASVPRGTAPVLADDGVRAAYVRLADWIQVEQNIL
ncbi:MinD/ParA family ATP-binding protein [Salinirubrum litoreum]|uniref:MinD/ParA family protein n=1 Tax=Salinirubrum litoreum TaxID=1126234 RepID=A0ABD5R6V6_9EURY|nr:cell division inhibitor MinD [Salinirubrum litoreum]